MRLIDRSKVEEIKERLPEFRMAELQLALTTELAKLFMGDYGKKIAVMVRPNCSFRF